ncbi:MAG TPA: enoyl-CoA hydratase [Acidimicrobiales bacterium]|nr:enoyl-CoA hydratase [Acidimicrobiales bacterium]
MSERPAPNAAEEPEVVRYTTDGPVGIVSLARAGFSNAQNGRMTYAIDDAYRAAVEDDAIAVIVLRGDGKHFSAGHDIGSPGRDVDLDYPRVATLQYAHIDKPGAERHYTREVEQYLGMCRRWREVPKPTIAAVRGACIAGGLMLAWTCDLIVASETAFFADPVLRMGIPGAEWFAHPFVMPPRIAKEFIMTGDRMPAARAYELGMVNRVVADDRLDDEVLELAKKIATMPRFGLALTKKSVNMAEDLQGLRDTIDATFHLHHLAHAHNELTTDNHLGGQTPRSMADKLKD